MRFLVALMITGCALWMYGGVAWCLMAWADGPSRYAAVAVVTGLILSLAAFSGARWVQRQDERRAGEWNNG